MADQEIFLFNQCKQGNREAFDTLFRLYYVRLAKFALKMLRNEELAEEVVQEMFIYLWENKEKIDVTTSVGALLYTSTRNRVLNIIKKEGTRQQHEAEASEGNAVEFPGDEKTSSKEIGALINEGLKVLPEKCREVFVLSKFEGLSYDEIAEYLDISKKTIENQMGIAFKKLREYLKPRIKDG